MATPNKPLETKLRNAKILRERKFMVENSWYCCFLCIYEMHEKGDMLNWHELVTLIVSFSDDFYDTPYCPLPLVLQVRMADNTNCKEFLPVEVYDFPEGITCSKCYKSVAKTTTVGDEHLCRTTIG